MRNKINKEKAGITIRFSVRLPKEQHKWLKEKAKADTEQTGKYVSMNDCVYQAIDFYKNHCKE